MAQDYWDTFWKQGFITTFGNTMPNNYQGPLRELWETIFSRVSNGGRVLDIATGSGALACIAAEISDRSGLDLDILAADFAKIPEEINAPEEISRLRKKINFFSNMPCEKLDFPGNHFDLITSQFGIEYSDWSQSLLEVLRTLKSSGSADFFCHREQAKTYQQSESEIKIYKSALENYKIFNAAAIFTKTFVEHGQASRTDSLALNKTINDFRSEFQGRELANMLVADIASQLKKLRTKEADQVAGILIEREAEYSAAQARLEDMLSAALSDSDLQSIIDLAKRIGFKDVSSRDLYQQGELIGAHIHMTK
ncbi:class I SAM-dependent methyltransferase [Microbulbifer flavimaris]|uniref:Class I SAM-dependent methyltransferase n=1 Tax=Microbulbifer flavimaris TaxID=1781068 RepID=A0ABX4HZY0_9GAMM|nr:MULTISPECIES: class I SAM-dependent methyltransferase [Microbulbifer]KUJ83363.1 hypothetical protein AVO43_05720 [Microbulbifer sp. ZGT114]PCO05518.1 class I SAM-dependent methyltransferase [Microbulbifer flavimaris]